MKAQAAFVRADGAVHLDAKTSVDLDFAAVIGPGDAEEHDAFGLGHALENFCLFIFWVLLDERPDGFGDFGDSLMKLGFGWVAFFDRGEESGEFRCHRGAIDSSLGLCYDS